MPAALLLQIAETNYGAFNWPGALVVLLGSGGLVTLAKYVGQPVAEYLKAKRESEAAERAEAQAQRRAKHEAEIAQIHVVTDLAKSVPATLEKLTEEIKNDRDALIREMRTDRETFRDELRAGLAGIRDSMTATTRAVEGQTAAVDALTGQLVSDDRAQLERIAEKVGAPKVRQADQAPQSAPTRPRLASRPL